VPIPAHRCNDWIQGWNQSNRNGDFVNLFDAEFRAGSDVPR
jgi:hypothetical protein